MSDARSSRRTVPRMRAGLFQAALLLLAACSSTPPEQALRESVAALEAAMEARDAGAVADLLADDFIGPDGMDQAAARRLAQLTFLRSREIAVALGPLDVDLHAGDERAGAARATVVFTAALAGGSGRLLPDSGSVYRVETGWRRDGGDWKLASARWERDL